MQLIAVVVLFWQRRRVSSLLRRAWAWGTSIDTEAGTSTGGRRARAARLAKQAAGRGWRAVDTEANAGRVSRFVAWMRGIAGTGVVARTSSPNGSAV